ncbi:MAG: hypothetical protein FWG34_03685 [Oscillospiraceae bacterium]|nr:hypothetical protein [Oscillospiraceae bacterium]
MVKSIKFLRVVCFFSILAFVFPLFFASNEKRAEELKKEEDRRMTIESEPASTENFTKTAEIPATEEPTEPIDEEELEWNMALESNGFEEGLVWLIDFIKSHPDSKFLPETRELLKKTRQDPSYSEKYLAEPNLDLIDEFIAKFPGHKDIGMAYELRKNFSGTIHEMMGKDLIAAVSVGESIMRNIVQIQNKTDLKLEVTIPFGTYFASNSGNVQNMLAREEKTFYVKPNQIGILYIDALCMNIYKDIPGEKSYFTVDKLDASSPFVKILRILRDTGSSYEVAQAAIWHMADSPGMDAIVNALVYENGEGAITRSDYEEALRISSNAAPAALP